MKKDSLQKYECPVANVLPLCLEECLLQSSANGTGVGADMGDPLIIGGAFDDLLL